MLKILPKIFPLFDHLYILQSLEYDLIGFLKWWIKNPLARNLQRKHRLELTTKAKLLLFLSTLRLIGDVVVLSWLLTDSLLLTPITIIVLAFFSPIYLGLAQIILLPFDWYQKNKIIRAAEVKISTFKNLKKVAIVGSFAKTSTKEMLYTLLWKKYRVVKTPKSYNTQLSVARSVLSDLKDNTEIFLIEMDAYKEGEIDKLAKMVKPQLAVITSIAPQHLERFGSMEKLAKTQFEIAPNLPEDGTLFLNSEDEWSTKLAQSSKHKAPASTSRRRGEQSVITYGFNQDDNFCATDIKQSLEGLQFNLQLQFLNVVKNQDLILAPNSKLPITLPLFGEHHIINFLAAASIAHTLGLTLEEIQQRALKILPTPHRLEIKKQGQLTIIDNSYNTNPVSSRAALKLLRDYPGKQKILITPGLVELGGEQHQVENIKFAKSASQVADYIIIVGNNAREHLLKGLSEANYPKDKIHLAKTLNDGLSFLNTIAKPDAVVLLENDLPDQYF
ncbi:MAG: UDP-N-acetylmuramoyl-tripeptide--D-alanyl-D-alanine ligase [Candidatus Daviesbacteria bacterium]|nr:UDP-N-acetylmuramoyl-tripeptide--D-alanyl-D-alanine ligase [Candidatus Daviesbacteria bacterium]